MPQVVAMFLFQIGAPMVLATWFATSAIAATLVNVAISVALTLAANALLRGQVNVLRPSDGQQEIKQPLPPRVTSYGRVRVSGAVWWLDAKTTVLYLGLAVNHRRISSYVSYHIDENEVTINAGTSKVTTAPYSTYEVYLYTRLGANPETKYSELLTDFSQDDMRGDGVATLLAKIANPTNAEAYQDVYPNGRPLIRVTIDATCVYDPRTDQNADDETTWEWSENWAVCAMDFIKSPDGYGIPWELIEPNIDEWIEAMDICDEQIRLLGGGTESRYVVAGSYRLTDDPIDVLRKMEAVADARIWQRRDGTIGVKVGKFETPDVTFTDDDIVQLEDFQYGQDPMDVVYGIRAEFTSPEDDYREQEPEPYPSGEEVIALGEDRVVTLDLLYCPSRSQARRIMKRHWARANSGWRGKVTLTLAGLEAIDERYIHLQIRRLNIDAFFEIDRMTIDMISMTVELEVKAIDASIDDWVPSDEGETSGIYTLDHYSDVASASTFDPIGQGEGEVGQLCILSGCSFGSADIPVCPTGWTDIGSANDADNFSYSVWAKILESSDRQDFEVNPSGAPGPIQAIYLNGSIDLSVRGLVSNNSPPIVGTDHVLIGTSAVSGDINTQALPYLSLKVGFDRADSNNSIITENVKVGDAVVPQNLLDLKTRDPDTGKMIHSLLNMLGPGDSAPTHYVQNILNGSRGGIVMASIRG